LPRVNTTPQEIIIRKTPFLFLKWLVVVEFLFALLPFLLATLLRARESYDASVLSQTVSYNLLVAIGMTAIQVLILATCFVAWYFPVYHVDKQRILYRRSNLFEDKELVPTQSIARIKVEQGRMAQRLDYGTLAIDGAGKSNTSYVKNIPNPAYYAERIESLVEAVRVTPIPQEIKPIHELIAGGEDQFVEFKSSLMWDYRQQKVNKNLYEPVLKNVVGFMNSTGGTVIIGVDDDGEVLGLDSDYQAMRKPNADGFENVFNMAFNKMVGVEFRRFVDVAFPEIDGKQVCVLTARPASQPAYLTHRGKESFYIRAGNACQPLTVSQAARYIQDHFGD
jgi:membrane protein YdbS with pleckstrin-like domain